MDFDVHLEGGNAVPGAGHFKIHIPGVILIAEDIGKHHHLIPLFDQTHGNSGNRRLDGHTAVHHCQCSGTNRRHGRRTVRLKNFGYDPDGIVKRLFVRKHLFQRPGGQAPMADIPAAGSCKPFGFPDGVGGKIVMDHKRPKLITQQRFNPLLVLARTERQHTQHLCFTPGKECAPMGPRQNADLTGNGADLIKFPIVDSSPLFQDDIAGDFFLQVTQYGVDFRFPL